MSDKREVIDFLEDAVGAMEKAERFVADMSFEEFSKDEKTVFAVSLEKQRYALNGVLLVTKEKAAKIEMVGTDGHRLAVIRRKAGCPTAASSWPSAWFTIRPRP